MKKIVVAAEGEQVTGHFGHCANFLFFDTADGAITGCESVDNPGHKPGFLPNFLADHGAEIVICGGLGAHASQIFETRGVTVITGASGDARAAVEAYLRGDLVSSGAVCSHHHGEHGEHHHHHTHD